MVEISLFLTQFHQYKKVIHPPFTTFEHMKKKIKSKPKNKPTRPVQKKKIAVKKTGVMKKLMSRLSNVMKGKKKPAKVVQKSSKKVAPKKVVAKKSLKTAKKVAKKVVKKATPVVKKAAGKKSSMKKVSMTSKKARTMKKNAPSKKKVVVKKSPAKKLAVKKSPAKKVAPQKKLQPKKVQLKLPMKGLVEAKSPAKFSKNVKVQPAPVVEVVEQTPPMTPAFTHEPVLVQEVLEALDLGTKRVVVDGTLGLGGHSKKMLEVMAADAQLIGFDVDDDNMAVARDMLKNFGVQVKFVRSNFGNLQKELENIDVKGVDAILLDLGLSSPQVDNAEKGFSFLRKGDLDMRFDKNADLTAADVVNGYSGNELMRIFREFGEEPFARKIAAEIVRRRKEKKFKTTTELADFIEKMIGRKGHIHPATRVFQALRIEVNHELDVLLSALQQALVVLKKGGRLVVIAYHSLEDRVVKQFFKECARDFINEEGKLTTTHLEPTLRIITKKPVVPSESEISKNPRSRSAKLRVAEKI